MSQKILYILLSDSCSKTSSYWMFQKIHKAGTEHVAHHTIIEKV